MMRILSHPVLRRGIREYYSMNLNCSYQQSLEEGFQGSKAEWKRLRGTRLDRVPYEKNVANGYQGTFKEWNLAENPRVKRRRTTGSCPYISSLKKAEIPSESQLILFLPDHRHPASFLAERWVLKQGHGLGRMRVTISAPEVKADEELWLYPYFNPVTKTLAFQRPDGTDHPYLKSLPRLAAANHCRPLLHLAQMEGLLDEVPDGILSDLSFAKVRESGFTAYSSINSQGGAKVCVRLKSEPSVRLCFYPAVERDRRSIVVFPYMGDAGELRLWDTEMDAPLAIRGLKGIKEGWDARTVRRRWPPVFQFAQSLGYWKDVQ